MMDSNTFTSNGKLYIPITSLEGTQPEAVKLALHVLEKSGIKIDTFNMDMHPIEIERLSFDTQPQERPIDAFDLKVCDPETVCADGCQNLTDCQKP